MSRLLLLIVFVCALCGCSSDISEATKYDSASGKTLVAIGISSTIQSYAMWLYRFDPITKRLIKQDPVELNRTDSILPVARAALEYRVTEIKPGTYVIMSFDIFLGTVTRQSCLNANTLAFTIEPGIVNYLGDVSYDGGTLSQLSPNEAKAAERIAAEFPNMKLSIKSIPTYSTIYELGHDLFGVASVCPGYY